MNWQGAKVLIAGGAGFFGTNFMLELVRRGADVRATWHEREPQIRLPGVEFVQADLIRAEDCRRVVAGRDYVLICAANTSGAAVIVKTPLALVTPNVLINMLLLEAAYEAGVKKTLFISSGAAYPDLGDKDLVEDDMFLGDPPKVYFPVGWMKRYSEILCRTYAQEISPDMPCVVIRPSNVFGPYDKYDPKRSHVTAALIRKVAEGMNPLEVWGTGLDTRDLLYVEDCVAAALTVFEKVESFDIVNIASGNQIAVRELLQLLLTLEGRPDHPIRFDASKPSTIRARRLSNQRLREVYGVTPPVSIEEGLRKTLAWFKNAEF